MKTAGALGFFLLLWLGGCHAPAWGVESDRMTLEADHFERPLDVSKLLKIRGRALTDALSDIAVREAIAEEGRPVPTLSMGDGIRLLGHVAAESKGWPAEKDEADYQQIATLHFLLRMARSAPAEELPALARVTASIEFSSSWRLQAFCQIAPRLIRREIAAIRAERPTPLEIALSKTPLPEKRAGSTPELREAWLRYVTIAPPDLPHPEETAEPWMEYSSDPAGFHASLDRLLRGEGKGQAEALAVYRLGRGCLVNGDLVTAMSLGPWLARLRERRLREAVSASYTFRMGGDLDLALARRELLAACGVDGAQLDAGYALAQLDDWSSWDGVSHSRMRGLPAAELTLLASGSWRDAGLALALERLLRAHVPRDEYFTPDLEALAIIAGRDGRQIGPLPPDAPPAVLPAPLIGEARRMLIATLSAQTPRNVLKDAIEKVAQLQLPEARPALLGLLTHEAAEIPGAAAAALRALGETVADPVVPGPVRFLLTLNGRPRAGQRVSVRVAGPKLEPAAHTVSHGIGTYQTDSAGILSIDRPDFLRFRAASTRVAFASENLYFDDARALPEGEGLAVFAVEIPFPERLVEEIPVAIETQPVSLEIGLRHPPAFYRGKPLTLAVTRFGSKEEPRHAIGSPLQLSTSVRAQVALEFQPGSYGLEVRLPGAAEGAMERLDVEGSPVVLQVQPAPATEVKFRLSKAGEKLVLGKYTVHLRGREVLSGFGNCEYGSGFRVTEAGKYTLRILPSAVLEREWRRDPNELRPNEAEHDGASLEFAVPASLPGELDLGKISVQVRRK